MPNKLKIMQDILNRMEAPLDELDYMLIDLDSLREPPGDNLPRNVEDSLQLMRRAYADMFLIKEMMLRQLRFSKKG